MKNFVCFITCIAFFSFQGDNLGVVLSVGQLVSLFCALIGIDFWMLKYFFIYIYNIHIIYIDKSSEQSGMHGVYKTDQLTN